MCIRDSSHGDVGRDHADVRGVIVGNDQQEIRDVAGGKALVIMAGGVEVRTSALEIGRVALGELMDVHGVLSGRKIFDVELDAHAFRRTG